MAKKEFAYRGKTLEELKSMSINDLAPLFKSNIRRLLKRGFTDEEKRFLEKLDKKTNKPVKTHCRDMVILPTMVGRNIMIHTGKDFLNILIQPEMIGHRLGEFALTRKRVTHSSAGVGATRSSTAATKR